MGIGESFKADVDALRNELGSACTLNAGTALGKCSINTLNPERIREALGDDFADEQDLEYAMIETDANFTITAQNSITVTATGRRYVVRRVTRPVIDEVVIANRCYCVAG